MTKSEWLSSRSSLCQSGLIESSLVNGTLFKFFSEARALLEKCAATALSSKLVARQKDFFAKMVVDAVTSLDELLPLNMIGMKKVTGGALEVRTSSNSYLL